MKKKHFGRVLILTMLLTLLGSLAVAQDDKAENKSKPEADSGFYKLDFVVRELEDGKTVNSRNYTMMARSGEWQQLRVGTRVPVATSKDTFNYTDVGLSVDCRILGPENNLALISKADITSLATGDAEKSGATGAPLIRHVQMNTSAPLTLGKLIVLGGVDELSSKHRFQLEVTAARAK